MASKPNFLVVHDSFNQAYESIMAQHFGAAINKAHQGSASLENFAQLVSKSDLDKLAIGIDSKIHILSKEIEKIPLSLGLLVEQEELKESLEAIESSLGDKIKKVSKEVQNVKECLNPLAAKEDLEVLGSSTTADLENNNRDLKAIKFAIKALASKEDLEALENRTESKIDSIVETMKEIKNYLEALPQKADLKEILTKGDLEGFATQKDVQKLESANKAIASLVDTKLGQIIRRVASIVLIQTTAIVAAILAVAIAIVQFTS